MAKRLTEQDIRRIVREEFYWADQERLWSERFQKEHPEEWETWLKIKDSPVDFGPGMVRDVLEAYWELRGGSQ